MIITTPALRIAAAWLFLAATPGFASEPVSCGASPGKPRLVCDEGACIRVPFRDLCDAVRASYPVKRHLAKPSAPELKPDRDELTLLIASVS